MNLKDINKIENIIIQKEQEDLNKNIEHIKEIFS